MWVPSSKLPGDSAFALVHRKVLSQKPNGRSVLIDDGAAGSVSIASRLVHPSPLAVLLLRLGELETETTLLDPLSKSVLQFLRLLLPDDAITTLNARTPDEIQVFMQASGAAFSHVVLVGHGRKDALKLPGGKWLPVADFVELIAQAQNVRYVISLACRTGLTDFGRGMTIGASPLELVGPTGEVHGATASLFAQQLLAEHLLDSKEFPAAVRRANAAVRGTTFAHWRNGVKNSVQKPGRKRSGVV